MFTNTSSSKTTISTPSAADREGAVLPEGPRAAARRARRCDHPGCTCAPTFFGFDGNFCRSHDPFARR